jgi:hypothetical protein
MAIFSTACRQTLRAYAFSPPESSSTSLAAAVLNLEMNWYRALRRAVAEAGEGLLLHVEQEKPRETRVWIGSGVGLKLEGSDKVELCSRRWKHDGYRYKAE